MMNIKRVFILACTILSSLIIVSTWMLFLSGPPVLTRAAGTSYTVCPAGPPLCDFSVIQDAVDAAGDGDVIKIAEGTYDDLNNSGGHMQIVHVWKSITLRGGYTTVFTEPPDPDANPTIMDAGGLGRVIYIGNNTHSTIEGLHITGGNAYGQMFFEGGGGIYIDHADGNIINNQIYSNTAWDGGGVRADYSEAIFTANTIELNTAGNAGGGMFLSDSAATLRNNIISENDATGGAAGIFLDFSSDSLYDNIISSNTTDGGGGGVSINASDGVELRSNTITSNTAVGGSGGGLTCGAESINIAIYRNTFSDNTADSAGGLDIAGCSGIFHGNLIASNTARHGGGLYLSSDSDMPIIGNTIRENSAVEGAGGIFIWETNATLRDNTIIGNTAGWGGGIHGANGDFTLINNIIADNIADGTSGILLGIAGDTIYMLHNTIARNLGPEGRGIATGEATMYLTNTIIVSQTTGIYVDHGATAIFDTTLWGAGDWANGTDWDGPGTIATTGDLWGNPDFVDYQAGDYHIGSNSDAIDAGVEAGVTGDIEGQPRPYQAPDIGADEYWPPGVLKYLYLPLINR